MDRTKVIVLGSNFTKVTLVPDEDYASKFWCPVCEVTWYTITKGTVALTSACPDCELPAKSVAFQKASDLPSDINDD